MKRLTISPLIVAGLTLMSLASAQAGTLKVGDAAPALKVAKWVKGEPVKTFEKGKVYVVEFWATWCGPCRVSIPHLTELAKKYKGKVTFTGVSVWERQKDEKDDTYMPKVASFVKDMGDKMNYNVAMDSPDKVMAKSWMEAADQNGIPAAFVIDKSAKIAWIGHPMAELDDVLGQVLADKFDAKGFAEKQAKERAAAEAEQQKMQELFGPVVQMMQKGQNKEALTALNKALTDNPKFEPRLAFFKYNLLLKADEAAAYPYARKLAEGEYKNNAQALNQLAWPIVDDKTGLKKPDYDVAIAIAERAVEITKSEDGMILDTLGYAYYKKGKLDKAIETQQKAVKQLEKAKDVPEEAKKEITDRLEMFKKKKAAKNSA